MLNRYTNSLSAPKAMGNNSGSIIKKKSHSINSTEKERSMLVGDKESTSSSKPLGAKNLKTMESEWNPIETKKAVNFREEMKRTKTILTNSTLTKPKRSLYEMETKKVKRTVPSSQHEYYEKSSVMKII